MKYEAQLYPFIEKYLLSRGIEIIQNEINFIKQLKTMDLLAREYDSSINYFIEVKKDEILKDDYYNLKYIMENNNIGKRKLGMLIGNCNNEELRLLIKKEWFIELIEISKVFKTKYYNDEKLINNNKIYYNPYKKYYRDLFKNISDDTLINFSIKDEHLIKIKYKIDDHRCFIFRGEIIRWKDIKGDVYIETKEYYFGDKTVIQVLKNINIKDLKKELYKIKYSNIFKTKDIKDFFEKINNECIYSLFDVLSNIVNLKEIKFTKEGNDTLKIMDSNFMISKMEYDKLFLCNNFIAELLKIEKYKGYHTDLKKACSINNLYNELNFFEFTNLIISNRLIEPLKTIEKSDLFYNITLKLELKDNRKIKRTYRVKNDNDISNVDFYLFSNWDIILHFQSEVNKLTNRIKDVIFEENYIQNSRWNKIKKKIEGIDTTRVIIERFINNEFGECSLLEDMLERTVWGFDENGIYTKL